MASADTDKAIRQMRNFILQEAHEKSNEIKLKADHDYQLEVQNLVHAGKVRVQEEYTKRTKDLEIQQRVDRSNAISASRVKKFKARDEMLENLKRESLAKLTNVVSSAQYDQLLVGLIVQGLEKIQESTVEVVARKEDEAKVTKAIATAITEFQKKNPSIKKVPTVTLSKHNIPSKGCTGGVILTAYNGRIVLNQTLEERLAIAYSEQMPAIRKMLFP